MNEPLQSEIGSVADTSTLEQLESIVRISLAAYKERLAPRAMDGYTLTDS